MIGVIVHPSERHLAAELFELLKTPWEFWQSEGRYEVVISTSGELPSNCPALALIFSGESTPFHKDLSTAPLCSQGAVVVSPEGKRVPIYGALRTFPSSLQGFLTEEATGKSVAHVIESQGRVILRVGYNLFDELRLLLTRGQPVQHAAIPTVDEHLAWLREWITRSGLPLVEIPPAPDGYTFIACLTHDIDHPSLRNHCCDHTMAGFLYRATVGTLLDVCRARRPFSVLWKNLRAAGMLPFVHMGLVKDLWAEFHQYLEIDGARGSTFFVIPQAGDPGRTIEGRGPAHRASAYGVADLLPQLRRIAAAGGEVAVHGLDSWLDVEAGRRERAQVAQVMPRGEIGVRMHWLYYDEQSAAKLEDAGFSYDSTVGYCETVGYRAGTTQVFKPPGNKTLLELPLHIMDTALFYPSYLHLKEKDAEHLVSALLKDASRIGGALTVNWHDRSLFPERQWDGFYRNLVSDLKANGAWISTASQAVAWFSKRRSARIGAATVKEEIIKLKVEVEGDDSLPGLRLRIHKPLSPTFKTPPADRRPAQFVDMKLDRTAEITIAL